MKHSAVLLSVALLAAPVFAEVPVFRDQVLTIDNAVVYEKDGPAYYADIRMKANADGSFSVVDADRRNLANIAKAEIQISKSKPVQVAVQVSGILSVACVALEETSLSRVGNTFNVVLAETNMPAGSVCMSLLAVTPFELDIPLSTAELPTGNYIVNVNGTVVQFSL